MKPVICPTCYAREIDPILLRYDESRAELYCVKCTWFGSEDAARHALQQLIINKYRIVTGKEPDEGMPCR